MKLPDQAARVFKGVMFDVYQWAQTMFDGSTATFEMIKRPDTVEIITVKDGLIWYADQEQPHSGCYECLFGGRVDEGETPAAAAARELQEEAGLISDEWELLIEIMPLQKMDWTNYLYIARNCRDNGPQNLDPGEKITIQSCTFDEFIAKIIDEKIKVLPLFTIQVMNWVYREPTKLEEFRKKLGL